MKNTSINIGLLAIVLAFVTLMLNSTSLKAQLTVAKDFTLTDTDGKTFNLFSTLNAGNAVLIDFWFAGCGPCTTAVAESQKAWVNNGSGNGCLKVIGLHTNSYESLSMVQTYKNTQGVTFPVFHCKSNNDSPYFLLLDYTGSISVPISVIIKPDKSILYMANPVGFATAFHQYVNIAMSSTFCTPLSTHELNEQSTSMDIYPNPFKDKITVRSNGQKKEVTITDALGAQVRSAVIENENTEIDLNELSAGVYFVKVDNTIRKIVKN